MTVVAPSVFLGVLAFIAIHPIRCHRWSLRRKRHPDYSYPSNPRLQSLRWSPGFEASRRTIQSPSQRRSGAPAGHSGTDVRCRRWRSVDTEPSRARAGLMLSKERIRLLACGLQNSSSVSCIKVLAGCRVLWRSRKTLHGTCSLIFDECSLAILAHPFRYPLR